MRAAASLIVAAFNSCSLSASASLWGSIAVTSIVLLALLPVGKEKNTTIKCKPNY